MTELCVNSTFGHHQKQSGFHPAATNIAPNNPKRNHLEPNCSNRQARWWSCDIYALPYVVFQPSIFRGELLNFGGCNTVDGRNPKQPVEVGSLFHDLQGFYIQTVVVWDFFHQQYESWGDSFPIWILNSIPKLSYPSQNPRDSSPG